MNQHYQVLIVGGGTAGIMTAAQLKLKDKSISVAIIDPSDKHYYQPAWTLVGAGAFNMKDTIKSTKEFIPAGVKWIQDKAENFVPNQNIVTTAKSGTVTYDFLVVCPGIQMDMDGIPGLKEAYGKGGVCSNYIDPEYTWKVLQEFKGGNAVFTQPITPIKCGGAPQKIMYLAADYFKKKGIHNKTNVIYATPGSVIFGVKEFADTLMQVVYKKGIILKTYYAPVKIDAAKKEIHFRYSKPGENACIVTESNKIKETISGDSTIIVPYDMLHLAPPQSAPDFIKQSPLAYVDGPNKGWLEVNINTLQHIRFANVFGLGDAAALPTAKTGAAIRKQVPVVVGNIISLFKSKMLANGIYEGYSSCPLVTGYGKMVLAEFKYNNVRDSDPLLSKFFDTTKELWSMWILKKYGLPYLYWNKMLRGKM
jgi:sulfide:quinone oxidoreductase